MYYSSVECVSKGTFVELVWDTGFQEIDVHGYGMVSGENPCKGEEEKILCDVCCLEQYLYDTGVKYAFPDLTEADFKLPNGTYGILRIEGGLVSEKAYGDYGYEYDTYFEDDRVELRPLDEKAK